MGVVGGRGVVGCGLSGFGFWWVIRWWSPVCLVVDCSGGGCCVFYGWWLWVMDLIWFLLLFYLGLWVCNWQWWWWW